MANTYLGANIYDLFNTKVVYNNAGTVTPVAIKENIFINFKNEDAMDKLYADFKDVVSASDVTSDAFDKALTSFQTKAKSLVIHPAVIGKDTTPVQPASPTPTPTTTPTTNTTTNTTENK